MATLAVVTAVLPVGALITALSQEVLKTAIAAQDVLVDQESFKILARYLADIIGVLHDFQRRNLKESPAVRSALDYMRSQVIDAQAVINSAKGKSRFYLLLHCRSIVKNAQVVTRGIGKALQLLLAAGAEVRMDIGEHVHRLKDQMVAAEFEASPAQAHVMNELERGLQHNKTDQGFANDLLRDIAVAVGVPTREADLRSELSIFQKEMEELALRKQDQEKAFMEQVLAVLFRAEAVSPSEDSSSKYKRLAQKADRAIGAYPPFPSFICPLTKEVMLDPVILGAPQYTESTYERSAIAKWLEEGNKTDPRSGVLLTKIELRPNNSLRDSIEEWGALNDIINIRFAKEMFLSGDKKLQTDALHTVCKFCEKNPEYKSWIGAEGFLESLVDLLKVSGPELKDVKGLCLDAVIMIVTESEPNKEIFGELGGLIPVVRCLSTKQYRSKGAALLRELSKNAIICRKIPDILGAILSLVTIYFHYEKDSDVGGNLRFVLEKLSENDQNVVAMAKANWCYPLIKRLSTGSDASKLCMAHYLASTPVNHLSEDSKALIAEGAVLPLVRMCKSGKIEAKTVALGGLSNLSCCSRLRSYVAAAGALPVALELQVSLMYPLDLREKAASVVANLCSGNGIKYFMDTKMDFLSLYQAMEPFLHFQEVSSSILRLHTLRAMLGMAQEKEARHLIRTGKGIPLLLLFLPSSDSLQARNCALSLLYYLSQELEGAMEIAHVVERRKAGLDLVRLLGENVEPYAQAAAAGILTNLPLNDRPNLKTSLLVAGVVSALVTLVRSGNNEVQENAVGALRHFTTPSDLEAQKSAANLDIHPVLVELLRTGSQLTKARAAQVLRNFSLSTSRLVGEPDSAGWICFLKPRKTPCRVHRGKCSVKGTFCLVEAEALAPLVSLLHMVNTEAAEAGVEALETLVAGTDVNCTGTILLHEVQGIQPLFGLLNHGSPLCSHKAVQLLEHIFKVPRMKEFYEQSAWMPLVTLSSLSNNQTTRIKSLKLLAQMKMGGLAYH